ncbi:MAG TPA: aldehyde dehydrogenase family protein [Acidimicrobiia bacterium]|nr:aldehyde dehydrogenase family protein [Acidimicrobiia bacterium]
MDATDIPALVKGLRASFDAGRSRPLEWRRAQLDRMRTMLREQEGAFLGALAADLGKPATEAYAADVGFLYADLDMARRNLGRWTRPRRVRTPLVVQPAKAYVVHEPLGVVLVIGPWNYPVQLVLAPLVGAIAGGNCAVLKPSEVAPRTSEVIARVVPRYLDPDCVAVVEGGPDETATLLAERFDHIFYTGNGRVARVVMEAAAKHLTPVTLELGGKSPVIVDDDVDLDVAARRIAWGKFLNAGQTCIAPDYALVTRSVASELIDRITTAIRGFYGPDPKASPDYARIVNDRHFERVVRLLDGAEIAVGGDHDASERYIAPTVLADATPDIPAMQEEIFGPVLPVLPVDGIDHAVELVNERDRPLALYVFSRRRDVARDVIARTSSGGACVNATMFHVAVPALPFGGVGPSGMGAYHGRAGFETFSHARSVLTRSTRVDPKIGYPPYSPLKDRLIRRFL